MAPFVSRAGQKLEHALQHFGVDVAGYVFADLGSNTGGFVDCLLQRGANKVYAVDTGYGALAWKLRTDPRVVVRERHNAMHVKVPEQVSLITIDVAWTKQKHILPAARRMLRDDGLVITLIKPHYEADAAWLRRGVLPVDKLELVLATVVEDISAAGFRLVDKTLSPITGSKGNTEVLALLAPI